MQYESVKLSKDVMKAVRDHVGKTKQSISGFIGLVVIESINKLNKKKRKT